MSLSKPKRRSLKSYPKSMTSRLKPIQNYANRKKTEETPLNEIEVTKTSNIEICQFCLTYTSKHHCNILRHLKSRLGCINQSRLWVADMNKAADHSESWPVEIPIIELGQPIEIGNEYEVKLPKPEEGGRIDYKISNEKLIQMQESIDFIKAAMTHQMPQIIQHFARSQPHVLKHLNNLQNHVKDKLCRSLSDMAPPSAQDDMIIIKNDMHFPSVNRIIRHRAKETGSVLPSSSRACLSEKHICSICKEPDFHDLELRDVDIKWTYCHGQFCNSGKGPNWYHIKCLYNFPKQACNDAIPMFCSLKCILPNSKLDLYIDSTK